MINTDQIKLTAFIEQFKLNLLNAEVDIQNALIRHAEIEKPGLVLSGFYEHFLGDRIQVLGLSESAYIKMLERDKRKKMLNMFFDYDIPCVILGDDVELLPDVVEAATKNKVPILSYEGATAELLAEAMRWLQVELAPRTFMHGVLVDVYGEGLLIIGESGIGKSETALELVKRGHRLIADDLVEIRRASRLTLFGKAPEKLRHLIELRGIGIVNIKELYGAGSIKLTQGITLVVNLVNWDRKAEYERIGLEDEYINILGNDVVYHTIPISPGRNTAIICEAAAINYRQRQLGFNAARALCESFSPFEKCSQ